MSLTKEEKKDRNSLQRLTNKVRLDHSMGRIKTTRDYFHSLGYDDNYISNTLSYYENELNQPISWQEVKSKLDDLRISLETEQWLKRNPPIIIYDTGTTQTEVLQQSDTISTEKKYSSDNSLRDQHRAADDGDYEKEDEKDYGLIPSNKEKAKLYWFQKKYAKELLDNLEKEFGQYLIAKAGDGKTYILGAVLRRLLDKGWHKENCISPWPIFVVTKASVVLQTEEVFRVEFGIDTIKEVIVVGVDQLRSRFGELFLEEKTIVEHGEEHIIWKWKPMIHPKLIVWDEAHLLKNTDSIQSKIGQSFGELEGVYQIFSSATPFTRVCEAKCFCVSTRITIPTGPLRGLKLSNKNWSQFADDIAYPGKPDEYVKESVNRLTDVMDKHIVRVKGVKWQFNPINDYELIDFITPEGREFYRSAEERFFRRKAKLEAGEMTQATRGMMLAIMTQYNIAAESNPDRARIIAQRMYHDAQEGYSPVCTMKYKISISRVIKILMEDYGVKREQFSVIWGGSKVVLSKKAQNKLKISANDDLLEALAESGISLDTLGLSDDDVTITENIQFPENLRLSSQNASQREEEKKNFLGGKTIYCFFSIKAGGVGLSLHHTDALTKQKCRRKPSGYVYEEDIHLIPTRQRRLYGPPAYSHIDIIQFLGRCGRLTSLSNTRQTLLWFRGTIEERVAMIYSLKIKCLMKVIRNRESWEDVIFGGHSSQDREAIAMKHLQEDTAGEEWKNPPDDDDNNHIQDTGSEDE